MVVGTIRLCYIVVDYSAIAATAGGYASAGYVSTPTAAEISDTRLDEGPRQLHPVVVVGSDKCRGDRRRLSAHLTLAATGGPWLQPICTVDT